MKRILFAFLLLLNALAFTADDYTNGPDSKAQDGVPKGEVLKFTFANSRVFPDTTREYWIYVPQQYDPAKPACLHVNQDGLQFLAPVVFDNLIAKKEMPVTIGVFVMHGKVKAASDSALDRFNRCIEYDAIDDRYVRFLLEELLPDAETRTASDGRPIRFSKDGNDRAIAGSSSGAIAAFTAAWHRPDAFQRVFSSIGTFVDHRGGNVYPALVRKTEAKPIRIFLQDGSNDGNGHGGNWFLANQEMLSAFEFAGYEVNHAWGDGGHNGKHATAIFPDAVRWLWKDWPKRVEKGVKSRQPTARILVEGDEWAVGSDGYVSFGGAAANAAGEVFFSDPERDLIYKIATDGSVAPFVKNADGSGALAFGPDGNLYAAQTGKKRIVAFDADRKRTEIVDGITAIDLVVSHAGTIFATDTKKQIWFVDARGNKRVVDTNESDGLNAPHGVALTPDQSLLIVSDARGLYGWSYHIDADGSLRAKQPFHYLHVPDGSTDTGARGMVFDRDGRIYVATRMGLQFCDQAGRLNGILSKPTSGEVKALTFGGAEFDRLYVFSDGKVFSRKTKVKGIRASDAAFKTKPPPL